MAKRQCWHCNTTSHMTQYAKATKFEYNEDVDDVLYVAYCRCDNCSAPNIAITESVRDDYGTAYQAPQYMENPHRVIYTWLPSEPRGKEYKDVPNLIASPASEAYACYSINSYRACILMARSVIEAICKDKNIKTGNLAQKIEQLAKVASMPTIVTEQANEIRYFGNEMAHGDFTQPVSEEDANDVLDLMDIIIDYVYQQPEQLAALKKRRELRKQNNEQA